MDFLRLEGEANYLALLPEAKRKEIKAQWYRKSPPSLTSFFEDELSFSQPTGIEYKTMDPQSELFNMLKEKLKPILSPRYDYTKVPEPLAKINDLPVKAVNLLPQISFVLVKDGDDKHKAYTLIHHNAHYNISSLLNEEGQRAYDEDTVTIVPGFIGDYPEAIWYLHNDQQIAAFVAGLAKATDEAAYRDLKSEFAIRRTHPQFWQYSDILHRVAKEYRGVEFGLFDYNRLENR